MYRERFNLLLGACAHLMLGSYLNSTHLSLRNNTDMEWDATNQAQASNLGSYTESRHQNLLPVDSEISLKSETMAAEGDECAKECKARLQVVMVLLVGFLDVLESLIKKESYRFLLLVLSFLVLEMISQVVLVG